MIFLKINLTNFVRVNSIKANRDHVFFVQRDIFHYCERWQLIKVMTPIHVGSLSRQRLVIQTGLQWSTYMKWLT